MAELSLRERLQPALLDRLVDEERLLVQYDIRIARAGLQRVGIPERDLIEILRAQGLERDGAPSSPAGDTLQLRFFAPYGRVSLSQLKSLVLKPPAAGQGVALQTLCNIEAQTITNDTPESGDRRFASMRRLREYVCRDLAYLLNSTGIDDTVDLERYPEVRRSVLNYGMPSLAGRAAVAIDVEATARAIEEVIRRFEPRLTAVRVTPDAQADGDGHQLSFRIEAELWGQPSSQHLVLRTQINPESGDVNVRDSGGGR
jgi:type VI secretion system protein ImpF